MFTKKNKNFGIFMNAIRIPKRSIYNLKVREKHLLEHLCNILLLIKKREIL
jgi:hypothetical protein